MHSKPGRATLGRRLILALAVSWSAGTALAQTVSDPKQDAEVVDTDAVEALRSAVESDTELDEATKSKVLELYQLTLEAIRQHEEASSRDAELINQIQSATQARGTLEQKLERSDAMPRTVVPTAGADSAQLRAMVVKTRGELARARDNLKTQTETLTRLKANATSLDDQLAQTRAELERIELDLRRASESNEPEVLRSARGVYFRTRRAGLQAEARLTRRQLDNFDLLVSLEALKRDVAAREVERIEADLERLAIAVGEQSAREAARARREAEATQMATAMLPRPLAALAEELVELRAEQERISVKTSETGRILRDTERHLDHVERDLETTSLRVETLGSSPAVGRLLRRRLDRLPSAADFRRSSRDRQGEVSAATDRRIDIEELLIELGNIDLQVDELIASLTSENLRVDEDWLREQAGQLVAARLETLADLARAYRRYLAQLVALDLVERQVAETVEEAVEFIARELIWIRSLQQMSPKDFQNTLPALKSLTDYGRWRQASIDMSQEFEAHPLVSALGVVIVALCFLVRRWAPVALAELGAKTRQIRTDSFTHTSKALGLTAVSASAWPLAVAFIGWHLHSLPRADFSAAVGASLIGLATFLLSISTTRWVLRRGGLGQSHFRWPQKVAESISSELRWLGILGWILVPVIATTERLGDPATVAAVGRPLYIIGMLALTLFAWRAFGPSSAFARYFARNHPDYWFVRLRVLWFPLVVVAPIAMVIAAIIGYQYTAETFTKLLTRETVWFLVGLLLLRGLLLRWFLLSERRLRLESAIRHREEARQEREQTEKLGTDSFDIEVPEPDYKELGQQARTLVRVGVFVGVVASLAGLWGDFVPFYSFLENITLPYSKTVLVEGVDEQVPATLADLLIGLLVLAATALAVKNLAGLLEFTVLQHLRLDAGARYAFLTLAQYAIVAFGLIAALSTMGMEWQKLQWLVAALGVGLGFGLQEIVANFVSGIILLVERPIRVGDIVTVGDASGAVSRIRIRATTIQTYDSQELLVPNKEFITGRLLNWTLTDQMARIVLYVGVAYGSDVAQALRLMLDAAVTEERVLDDPAPTVNFEGFGDNSLNLSLRAYVASLDHRLAIQTALNTAIYEKFAAAGIEISFPQRDVHLDTREPLQIRVLRHDSKEIKT